LHYGGQLVLRELVEEGDRSLSNVEGRHGKSLSKV
jgi:hypothetical protein